MIGWKLLLLPGNAIQRSLKNIVPLPLEDLPVPMEAGTGEQSDDNVADVFPMGIKVSGIAID